MAIIILKINGVAAQALKYAVLYRAVIGLLKMNTISAILPPHARKLCASAFNLGRMRTFACHSLSKGEPGYNDVIGSNIHQAIKPWCDDEILVRVGRWRPKV